MAEGNEGRVPGAGARAAAGPGLVAGKVVLITGAGSGIGRAAAELFAREGARVAASDIDDEGGQETVAAIRAAGGEAEFFRVDVSKEAEVVALVRGCVERFGRLDCALNNAGISGPIALVHQIASEDWQRILDVNLSGVFYCMKHELPVMQAQGGGVIVNMSSGGGVVSAPGMAGYCASKHAVLGLTKTAAQENARTGVRVNALCPGSTDTPMLRSTMTISPDMEKRILASVPGGRLGTAEEIAEAAVWLCSDRSSFVSGLSMLIDGASVSR